MSYYDSEPTLKIGSKFAGSAAQPRETTIKGKSALNAAYRVGGVSTEKKYATPNQVSRSQITVKTPVSFILTTILERVKPRGPTDDQGRPL